MVVGLEETSYVDSAGLAMLASLHRELVREWGGRLRISGASPQLRRLFEATRLSSVLEVVESEAEREETVSAPPEDRASLVLPESV